ncbi:MAG: FAD-dependent oxidoreductase [bacterium]
MKIVIIGAGFAGIAAARQLSRSKKDLNITLINRYTYTQFRPLFPDIISRSVAVKYVSYSLNQLAQQLGFNFIQGTAVAVNTDSNSVSMDNSRDISYDFLIIATGSETPVPGKIKKSGIVNTLDTINDSRNIADTLHSGEYQNYVICGGGYTGIETASHVCKGLEQYNQKGNVLVVEMAETILSNLPEWMRVYTMANCERLGIEIKTNTKITETENRDIILTDGTHLTNALLIWSTGLNAVIPCIEPAPTLGVRNRIKVNNDLRVYDNVFAAGDCACTSTDNGCFRMAVQSSISSGICAADNLLALIGGYKTHPYYFTDPGFIVPMPNWYSCGIMFGRQLRGRVATFLHYIMSSYRSYGFKNKIMVMVNEFF